MARAFRQPYNEPTRPNKETAMLDQRILDTMMINVPAASMWRDNIRITEAQEPGFITFETDVPAELGNYRNGIHGGTAYTIGEIGCGFAMYSFNTNNVCQSANINFLKAVPCCTVVTKTEPIHKGRSTAVIRVSTYQKETGKLLFQSTHNMFLFGPVFEDVEQ
ncbi:PaaI family thioesterase [Slackia heliotrinireducens]|jgi:acyl-coenzyme A thioesterase PaaI-like protein|nr:PaaI family thioesterase [Slackia heliotrinireducens]